MPGDQDSSDLSSLSSLSPAPSDDEIEIPEDVDKATSKKGILGYFSKVSEQAPKEPSPPPRKRSPSPPHEYVLADNPDISFIVMFRSRFNDAFPKSLTHFGPQELERDVVQTIPGDRVESFLCAILGLLLNRKQDVKPGHYGRALEDAISTHKSQWPSQWEGKNPLSGNRNFNSMDPTERLTLLRTLILWSLSSSETVKGLITQSYKQNRHEDDLNQPRSVQPWGTDGEKRRYFLIEGQDDTAFRVYRESNPAGTQRTWFSVAGSIEELAALADKLEKKDGGPKAKRFASKIIAALPRFEAGEEKRRRRDYRQAQKERFKRPDPGFSMYEGRTRGKKMRYTYSDDEDMGFSDSTNRRSARNTGANTPAEQGPTITASGRQIKAPSRLNVATGESASNSVKGDSEHEGDSLGPTGRPRRSAAAHQTSNDWTGRESRSRRDTSADSDDEETEAEFGDDEDEHVPEGSDAEDDFDEDIVMEDEDLDDQPRSLVVKLSVTPPKLRHALTSAEQAHHQTTDGSIPSLQNGPDSGSDAQDGETAVQEKLDSNRTPVETKSVEAHEGERDEPVRPSMATGEISVKPTSAQQQFPQLSEEAKQQMMTDEATRLATSLAFRGSPEKPHPSEANVPNGHVQD
ncbi:uncharacterized protein F5Z01DRAFT_59379 [Emericellopsis atlantica]|uniref:WHIM1 domain-containing protein n=1 Tax=Emericellopsis atlantica TaxID=2614577 RepID=A0A9P8CRN0_9HYPO|nr:uncharacterized protein F5Z01DRAFT_59379 [Emericellopsis atlantica]KAG9254911.1 hypothetical protein F5Z01DRAFT_59379 [Emericellopsis atlantica]